MDNNPKGNELPRLGITLGDYNGVGPELIIRTLSDSRILKMCTPFIYGSGKVISQYRKIIDNTQFNYSQIKDQGQGSPKKVNLINVVDDVEQLSLGQVTDDAGKVAYEALKACTADLIKGNIDAMVTSPINKNNLRAQGFEFPGHTEFVTKEAGAKDSVMLLTSEEVRVGVVTGHIPLSKVKESITKELIIRKATILHKTLKKDFGIPKPKIAVLGLNPHAGEGGMLGNEDIDVISPAIEELRSKNILAMGPFPADGFFGAMEYKKYDAVLGMYHDQGLIPFKTLAFGTGVNYTAGLNVVRTSPDHGTAYSLAGKGKADLDSFRAAIYLAIDVIKNRSRIEELVA